MLYHVQMDVRVPHDVDHQWFEQLTNIPILYLTD
jgi:muconolactone delta-isomerase